MSTTEPVNNLTPAQTAEAIQIIRRLAGYNCLDDENISNKNFSDLEELVHEADVFVARNL